VKIEKLVVMDADEEAFYFAGVDHVVSITEHAARGDGDRWFYDVHLTDGRMIREFRPVSVEYAPDKE